MKCSYRHTLTQTIALTITLWAHCSDCTVSAMTLHSEKMTKLTSDVGSYRIQWDHAQILLLGWGKSVGSNLIVIDSGVHLFLLHISSPCFICIIDISSVSYVFHWCSCIWVVCWTLSNCNNSNTAHSPMGSSAKKKGDPIGVLVDVTYIGSHWVPLVKPSR
jgi:hypothetical protein